MKKRLLFIIVAFFLGLSGISVAQAMDFSANASVKSSDVSDTGAVLFAKPNLNLGVRVSLDNGLCGELTGGTSLVGSGDWMSATLCYDRKIGNVDASVGVSHITQWHNGKTATMPYLEVSMPFKKVSLFARGEVYHTNVPAGNTLAIGTSFSHGLGKATIDYTIRVVRDNTAHSGSERNLAVFDVSTSRKISNGMTITPAFRVIARNGSAPIPVITVSLDI